MRRLLGAILSVVIAAAPMAVAASQRAATTTEEIKAAQQMAAAIPLGSRVKVESRSGPRMKATLMAVTDEAIVVKRESRVPEPAVTIRFDELLRLERAQKDGFSMAKALGVGVAAGAGAILTIFAIAMSLDD